MVKGQEAEWAHYTDVSQGELMQDRFTKFWKPSNEFGSDILDVSVIKMKPGEGGPKHSHEEPIEEYYIVINGTVDVELPDKTVQAEKGTIFYFPPDSIHRPINNSGEEALLISFRAEVDNESELQLEENTEGEP